MSRSPDVSRRPLPRVAYGDPAAGARVLAEQIPGAITQAEAIGAGKIAEHLRVALLLAERRAVDGAPGLQLDEATPC